MPRDDRSLWYAVGRALESTLGALVPGADSSRPKKGKKKTRSAPDPRRKEGNGDPLGGLLTGALSAAAASAALRWSSERRPSFARLLRGAAAGAGAAGVLYAARVLLTPSEAPPEDPAREVGDELLAGAGRGVLYAALLDPLLPGPPLLRGALAGTADFFAAPIGGLFARLQPLSPIRRVPVISILLETGDAEGDPYLAFLLHGALLGVLYGDPGAED